MPTISNHAHTSLVPLDYFAPLDIVYISQDGTLFLYAPDLRHFILENPRLKILYQADRWTLWSNFLATEHHIECKDQDGKTVIIKDEEPMEFAVYNFTIMPKGKGE